MYAAGKYFSQISQYQPQETPIARIRIPSEVQSFSEEIMIKLEADFEKFFVKQFKGDSINHYDTRGLGIFRHLENIICNHNKKLSLFLTDQLIDASAGKLRL